MRSRRLLEPRKAPRQARSRETVEAILKATAYILVREGYARLTTNRVAARAGVNIASLYQFFPNKEALVAELQRRHVEEARARARAAMRAHRGRSVEATVRALVQAGIAAHAVNPALHRVFEEEMPAIRRGPVSEDPLLEERKAWISSLGLSTPDIELVAWLVRTASHAAVHRGVTERPEEMASGALTEELVLLLVSYLKKKLRGSRRKGRAAEAG